MDFADDFVVDDPLTFGYFLEGGFLQISSGLEVMLGFFVSPNLVCLNDLDMIVDFTEFGVLDFFWDLQNSPFL